MKKYARALGAVLAASALALTACSAGGSSDGSTAGSGSGGSGDPLVVYSNSVSDGRGEWLTDAAKKAGFEIQFVDLGGADVMNRLIAEKANPVADVVFGLNQVYYEKLDAQGVLADSKPSWADKVDAEQFGNGKTYWPIVREPVMLVYNPEALSGAEVPTDWPDLWTKKGLSGRYETPAELGGATTQMVLSGILTRYADEKGDLGISDEGWNAVKQYFKNGNRAVEGEDLYARIAAGEVDAGQMWLAGKAMRDEQYGLKTEAVHPKIGVPMVAQSVAVVKGTKHEESAQKFLDWFGGAESQAAWSKQFFTAPMNEDAIADANADAVKQTDSFETQEVDWAFVATNIDAWVEKVTLEYLG
ncbi:extracellular solute-binding protein [Microbacterium gorillae]|uniref:extracellular solute-binding protein n=1 Tax=Microbacterium gorillae TaxID=1231063 RepID=UPI00058E4A1A|nr:extracellular solute-binding protein [Microbacterium gorillae]